MPISLGVPQQLSQHPGSQFGHLGAVRGVSALLKDTFDIVVGKELYIRPQHAQVRMRHYVMPEIRSVVPDVQPIAYLRPADDIIAEFFISFVGQRFTKRALDTAQTHNNIVPRLYVFGRLACILISQRAYGNIRKFLFNIIGHGIDESQHQSRRTFFFFFDSGAFSALTIAVPIVL